MEPLYLFLVLIDRLTSHSLLILMVSILGFFSNIDSSCLGNMTEDFNFEYGDDTMAHWGCGATLHNVFWYFGGDGSERRQVKLQKYLFNINLFHFRSAKS